MIKGMATIQFGSGSVVSLAGVDDDTGVGVIFMKSTSPGKAGRKVPDGLRDELLKTPEVVIYFTTIESVDSMIHALTTIRDGMIEDKEKEPYTGSNTCVCCSADIPEGTLVCPRCAAQGIAANEHVNKSIHEYFNRRNEK